jgi:hypothetical protein
MAENKLLRMDNVGIVVESLDKAIAFFGELGLKLEGRGMVIGWAECQMSFRVIWRRASL